MGTYQVWRKVHICKGAGQRHVTGKCPRVTYEQQLKVKEPHMCPELGTRPHEAGSVRFVRFGERVGVLFTKSSPWRRGKVPHMQVGTRLPPAPVFSPDVACSVCVLRRTSHQPAPSRGDNPAYVPGYGYPPCNYMLTYRTFSVCMCSLSRTYVRGIGTTHPLPTPTPPATWKSLFHTPPPSRSKFQNV